MAKLSENQQAAVDHLKARLNEDGAEYADKSAWKKNIAQGVSVNTASMLRADAIVTVKVSVGSRIVEVFKPA